MGKLNLFRYESVFAHKKYSSYITCNISHIRKILYTIYMTFTGVHTRPSYEGVLLKKTAKISTLARLFYLIGNQITVF